MDGVQTFGGLVADRRGVGGVPLGRVQGRGHGGVTVLEVHLRAAPAEGAGQPLIVPGLPAVALAVHGALAPLQVALVLRRLPLLQRAGPPGLLGRGRPLWLGGAQQAGHGQHPLNGLLRAGRGRTVSAGGRQDTVTKTATGRAHSCSRTRWCTHRLSGLSLCLSFWLHRSSWMVCPEPFCWDDSLSTS